jgi:microcystin-dependent protein
MVGDTKTSMVRVDHLGWLVCDGRQLLQTDYRSLYAVIGDDFGDASAGYFRLPDAQGRVVGLIGQSDVSSAVWTDGDVSGEYEHTLTIAEIPAHNHDISGGALDVSNGVVPTANGNTSEDGAHTHQVLTRNDDYNNSAGGLPPAFYSTDGVSTDPVPTAFTTSADAHRHQIASNGGSQAHNNIQPTIFMGNLFIYCGQPGRNITQADGVTPGTSFYPPSTPANRLY